MISTYKINFFLLGALFFFCFTGFLYSQQERINIVGGDSLKKFEINGVQWREISGGIITITQGNLTITCKIVKHFPDKNEAELIGDVIAVQDTMTIKTPRGYYWGETRKVFSESGLELDDSHYKLTASRGYYYFDEKRADFFDNVNLFDKISNVNAAHLTYFRLEDKAIAVGNVMVSDTSSVIFADSLIHFKLRKISHGFKNVKIFNPRNRSFILAGEFQNNDSTGYANIKDHPLFVQIDSTAGGKFDTLYISAKTMDAYQDSTDRFTASDSVKMFRTNFAAVNNFTTLFRKDSRIFSYRLESDTKPPVIWYEESQLYGDSIMLNMEKKKLKLIEINRNAFMLSLNEGQKFRFDQMSGRKINMNFADGEINRIDIDGALLSIYYLYDNKEPNGLVKASSERGKMYFKEKKVDDVKLYGSVISDYHPENVILGKEKDFTLPGFILYKNKPRKDEFYNKEVEAALIKLDEIIKNTNGKYPNIKK